jgi:alpha-beta hydrolase superfamily lysophospholipase
MKESPKSRIPFLVSFVSLCIISFWVGGIGCDPVTPTESTQEASTEQPTTTDNSPDAASKPEPTTPEPTTPEPTTPDTSSKPEPTRPEPTTPDTPSQPEAKPEPGQPDGPSSAGCGKDESVVTFSTSDKVKLEADYWPAASANRGAVILFHMNPQAFNRSNFPQRIRKMFNTLDLTVLNVDRRGANGGGSGGNATEAFSGPKGRLDVQAAMTFLLDPTRQCPINTNHIVLVGASNGSTSVLDYTLGRTDQGQPAPAAMIWLSPGTYTEAQYKISANLTALKALPILMIHPTSEPYSTQYKSTSTNWKVIEVPNGRHGTQNFDNGTREAIQAPAMVDWLKSHAIP